MADTYTTSLRLQLQAFNGNLNTWGGILDTQLQLIDNAITGDNGYAGGGGGIGITGLTTFTLTVANGATDEARQLLYPFVGALGANCTVTLPGVVKIGYAMNATTGGYSVILRVGGGAALTLPPSSGWVFFYCDGTNVTSPPVSLPNVLLPHSYTQSGLQASYTDPCGIITKTDLIQFAAISGTYNFAVPFPTRCDNVQLTIISGAGSYIVNISNQPSASGFSWNASQGLLSFNMLARGI